MPSSSTQNRKSHLEALKAARAGQKRDYKARSERMGGDEDVEKSLKPENQDPVASEGFMSSLLDGLGQDTCKPTTTSHLANAGLSDQKKRKNEPNLTRVGLSPTALRTPVPEGQWDTFIIPPLGDDDFATTENFGDGSSVGVGGFLSSEGMDDVEPSQGLNWQKALQALPTISKIDTTVDANLKVLIDDSEDKPQSSEESKATPTFPARTKLRKPTSNQKALAKAEADRHLPQPTKVDAFLPPAAADAGATHKLADTPAEDPQGNRLKFFWLDFQEAEGIIYLFGKVFDQLSSKHVACCVIVEGMQRNLFVLPRPTMVDEDGDEVEPTEDDVYDEIEIFWKLTKSLNSKLNCRAQYCFEEKDMPADCDKWLKVSRYCQAYNGKTFSKIFGTGTTGTHDVCRRSCLHNAREGGAHVALYPLGPINSYDPDIIVGYDLANVALDVILHRMRDLKPHIGLELVDCEETSYHHYEREDSTITY
ncbi:hypothetical protein KEM48_009774 [Puccinia striiformis f. sp. tritici PST-130]|nr:hypothetical protein KEM48_009774 [Puccinia striiformis f. sp. tritici PST-130]